MNTSLPAGPTGLLASVTGPDEAEIALAGGADIIDLKDPAKGALGAVAPDVLVATLARIAGRRPVSAVAGDLPMEPDAVCAAVALRRSADHVKIGLFPASAADRRAVVAALSQEAARTSLIAVFFADGDPDFSLLADLKAAGFSGAMIDTMNKGSGGLLKHLPTAEIAAFVESCRTFDLISGLAGSLEPPDVPRLAVLRPHYLGFRGALTTGGRAGPIDPLAVAAMRALIDAEQDRRVAPDNAPTDRIFVRDMVVEMEIGAYGFERGQRQSVRFTVEGDVVRTASRDDRMVSVYSYDIIMDAVRRLVARGHTDLVETLAEDLAEMLLADPRLRRVLVRVEKLQLGPAAVGIEIRRPDAGSRL
ncbi:hypothetical protein ASG43_10465 [Aureimonas sp. Leaf454]|uniref:(5-formylfuran-3-yl)methyl phosphate synthase n=1 Tax=Aureimonas sp. Leaf454 TaxID=1736381 RepID=UPI0007002D8A|nr:(5-formylfuran-3-yl)methyl phosphate synthase [Aureimonas sp. Leaf454]KQT47509.1 hypothetical protein ASG43_10465 [Aureimonas sp. Leaf454]